MFTGLAKKKVDAGHKLGLHCKSEKPIIYFYLFKQQMTLLKELKQNSKSNCPELVQNATLGPQNVKNNFGGGPLYPEADVAQSVDVRPSEMEGRQFDPRHSIDVCFDFLLFFVAVALNTRKTEH